MIKRILFALLLITGVTRLFGFFNRRQVTILCYHCVTAQQAPILEDPHKLHIPVSLFTKHLEYLKRHHNVISLDEFLVAVREQRPLPNYSVVLTFDDGVRNFLTVAAPLLKRLNMTATHFVITSYASRAVAPTLNHQWQPEDDRNFLSWPDIEELARDGITFGSHTCTHRRLPELSVREAEKELVDSREALRARVHQTHFALSYPHGQVSDEVRQLAQEAGYSCGMTTMAGGNHLQSDLFDLRRTVIAGDDDLPTFAARVAGLTARINSLRRTPEKPDLDTAMIYPVGARAELDT